MYPSGSSHRHRHPPPFTANMHGPIPRILEPSPEPVLAGGGLTSRGTTHSSAQQQLQQQQSTPTTQFFQPGDVYATFQTAYSSGPHHAPFALPSPYNTPWTTTGRGGPPKMRPRFPLHQQQRHKYPALTFTHHPQLPNGQPQRNFFRPPSTATATTVNGYLAPGRPMMNGGGGAYRSTNSTPPAVTAGVVPPSSSSMVNNPFLFVSPDTSSQQQSQRRHSMPSTAGIAPYFVDLHVGSGSAVQVDNGPEKHIVTGPASVTIMSNCSNPPTAIPVTVPPGQYVQQMIDDRGVLRSVYISNQPYTDGSIDNFQHSYYVPAQMQLQMPIHNAAGAGASYPAQFSIPHPIAAAAAASNGMQQQPQPQPPSSQNGFPSQQAAYASQEFLGFSPQQITENRDYAARQKLKRKFESKKRPVVGSSSSAGRRYPDYENHNGGGDHHHKSGRDAQPAYNNGSGDGQHHHHHHVHRENGGGDAGSESPPSLDAGPVVETEDDVLATFFSTIQPVTVNNIKANSVTITCNPLDFTQLDASQLDKYVDLKESDWEYFVLCGEGAEKQRIFTAGTAPQLTLQLVELRPNTEYLVCAQVGYGDLKGKQSESVTFRTAKAQPEPPEAPRLTARTKNSLAVKWLPSRCDNGSKITKYIVEHDQGRHGDDASWMECYSGLDKQAKLTRLQPETTYRVRVFAENDIGRSLPSPVVSVCTAGVPPVQPEPPSVIEVSAHHIVFEWQKRACDDSFVLQLEDPSSGHGFLSVYTGHDTFCSCKDLTRVTDYKVRLAAENTEGLSPFSAVVSITTRAELPGCPSKPYVKGKVSPHSFRAQWDPPADTGGEIITEYVVECTGTDGFRLDYSGPETNLLVKDVAPGQTYFFRVHACNSMGMGSPSEVCMIHTPPVAPGAPLPPVLSGKPKATGAALRWDPPLFTGGEGIANYELKKIMFYDGYSPENDGVVVYYGPAKENYVEGLSAGKAYLFLVRAYNTVGPGPWSDVMQVETGAGPPDAPETLRLQAKNANSILASWKEPWGNGAPVTEYKLEMSETDESEEQNFVTVYTGSKLLHEVKNLKSNSEYFFRLTAANVAGTGPSCPLHSCWTPPAAPMAVDESSVNFLVSPTAITLSWEAPDDSGSAIIGYKVECDQQVSVVDQPVSQCLLDGLRPDTVYKIRIQATNSIGDGNFSGVIKVKTKPVVPDVPKLEVQSVTHGSIKVKWSSVVKSGTEVEYVLEMAFNKKDVFQTVYRGNQTSHKLNKVREDTLYFFRVRAVNEAGDSPQSDVVDCRTPKSPPPAVKAPKVVPGDDFCLVQWPKLLQCEGEDISYVLQCSKSGAVFLDIYKGAECQFKYSKLEPGISYQFRVKPVRVVLCDARSSIPGSWSPVAAYTLPLPSLSSSNLVAGTSAHDQRSPDGAKDRTTASTRKTFRQWLGTIDFADERVALVAAGTFVLICVLLISSYVLLSN